MTDLGGIFRKKSLFQASKAPGTEDLYKSLNVFSIDLQKLPCKILKKTFLEVLATLYLFSLHPIIVF